MKSLKQQFQEFRSTTPKRVQWLLLAAAFVIVIILLVLLFGHKSDNNKIEDQIISFSVEPEKISFVDTVVGDTKNQNLNITVNTPVVLDGITVNADNITTMNNCDNLTDSCLVNVIYKPTAPIDETETTLKITWHILAQADVIKTYEAPVVFSAYTEPEPIVEPEPEPEPIIEPVVEPEPEPEPAPVTYVEFDDDDFNWDDEDDDNLSDIADDIRAISSPDVFKEFEPDPEFSLPPEKCSDFAIPGYNQAGVQIGWIKPENGANYFHPFSDHDCSNPTGKYDFSTGVITSLKDGSRIGTDANHIGYRDTRELIAKIPQLSEPAHSRQNAGTFGGGATWVKDLKLMNGSGMAHGSDLSENFRNKINTKKFMGSAAEAERVVSSQPYDRTFILRQFKPIPATIVSEVRADPSVYGCSSVTQGECKPGDNYSIPVRATVDRNVFSDDGRTIIIPTGTLLMGYLSGELPGPYQTVGRMNIKWYQFIRPDGVEFNFEGKQDPYSADAQGRVGVPGHGSTDYIEQMVMPILTSLVPAAVNMIAPIADTVINQIDLDNNTIVQSGTVRSSEMAKQEIISTWNKVAQKLLVDVMANTIPPFSIAAGTRINVYSPVDLVVTCGDGTGKKCSIAAYNPQTRRNWSDLKEKVTVDKSKPSWVGQVRSFDLQDYCEYSNNKWQIGSKKKWSDSGYDYRTVYAYCESMNYEAKNNAKQNAYNESVQSTAATNYGTADAKGKLIQTADQKKAYNQEVLGLTYNDDGTIANPFAKQSSATEPVNTSDEVLTCEDGLAPDNYGCCTGETYTDMGEAGWNCCPDTGGDCFPPITVQ